MAAVLYHKFGVACCAAIRTDALGWKASCQGSHSKLVEEEELNSALTLELMLLTTMLKIPTYLQVLQNQRLSLWDADKTTIVLTTKKYNQVPRLYLVGQCSLARKGQ